MAKIKMTGAFARDVKKWSKKESFRKKVAFLTYWNNKQGLGPSDPFDKERLEKDFNAGWAAAKKDSKHPSLP